MPKRLKTKQKPGALVSTTRLVNYVRAWREFRRLSQDELVEKAREQLESLSKSTLSRLENGKPEGGGYRQPVLEALAWALDCRPSDLLEWPPTDPRARIGRAIREVPDEELARLEQIIAAFRRPTAGDGDGQR